MATLNIHIIDTRQVKLDKDGFPLGYDNSYRIIAGENNATIFNIATKPTEYSAYDYYVTLINSQGYKVPLKVSDAEEITTESGHKEYRLYANAFTLPAGMAVKGYGYIGITAKGINSQLDDEVVPFQPIKVKIWETIEGWKEYVIDENSLISPDGYWIINGVKTNYKAIGEKGDKGNTGAQGAQGIQGIQGEKGADGQDGADGKSAYQIWLENGHSGSETDFLASLKGDTGDNYIVQGGTHDITSLATVFDGAGSGSSGTNVLPTSNVTDGTVYYCYNANGNTSDTISLATSAQWQNGFLAQASVSNGTVTWAYVDICRPNELYLDLETGNLYRYSDTEIDGIKLQQVGGSEYEYSDLDQEFFDSLY